MIEQIINNSNHRHSGRDPESRKYTLSGGLRRGGRNDANEFVQISDNANEFVQISDNANEFEQITDNANEFEHITDNR